MTYNKEAVDKYRKKNKDRITAYNRAWLAKRRAEDPKKYLAYNRAYNGLTRQEGACAICGKEFVYWARANAKIGRKLCGAKDCRRLYNIQGNREWQRTPAGRKRHNELALKYWRKHKEEKL